MLSAELDDIKQQLAGLDDDEQVAVSQATQTLTPQQVSTVRVVAIFSLYYEILNIFKIFFC